MLKRTWRSISIIVVFLSAEVWGCGPDFPNSAILGGDEFLREMPAFGFAAAIERLKPPLPQEFEAMEPRLGEWQYGYNDGHYRQTSGADVNDLWEALGESWLGRRRREKVVQSYKAVRKGILDYRLARSAWKHACSYSGIEEEPVFQEPEVPKKLPTEFTRYLEGAICYYQGDMAEAREAWESVLELDEKKRKYRSTWAAFMIGWTLVDNDDEEAIKYFRRVREFVRKGFRDSIGLGAASIGWEAKAYLNLGRYEKAIELYLAQYATGDRSAMASLRIAARMALAGEPKSLLNVAKIVTARRVVTAYVLGGKPSWEETKTEQMGKWVAAIEEAGVAVAEEADRLAWAAYGAGEMELAKRWASVADENSLVTRWVKSRLYLREGKVRKAAEELAKVSVRLAPAKKRLEWDGECRDEIAEHIQGELGVLRLRQKDYLEAMDIFLKGGLGEDAAYVAERVLTIEELKSHVNRRWGEGSDWRGKTVRHILARRLTRAGRWDEAREYYPEEWRGRFDAFHVLMERGDNRDLGKDERAEALWRAARIAFRDGMEIFGTEIEPDWHAWDGQYNTRPFGRHRSESSNGVSAPATDDEKERVKRHVAEPEKRFHYRYVATEIAWEAAEFMPDNSDETARILCTAGSWLKVRDPNYADKFYKALVLRCRKTQLGKEADARRWFPAIEDEQPPSAESHWRNRTSGEGI